MAAVITPTRRPLLTKLRARVRCVYLRWLIRHAEHDLARHKAEFEHASKHLPAQMKVDRDHIAALTAELIREERNT